MYLTKASRIAVLTVSALLCAAAHAGVIIENKPNPEKDTGGTTRADSKNSQGPATGPNDRPTTAPLADPNGKKVKGALIDPNNRAPKDPALDGNLKK